MADEVFGLTKPAARLVHQMADVFRQRLPDVGRRTRRVYSGGSATEATCLRILCEIESWEPDALHGAGAVCVVKFKVGAGTVFDIDFDAEDVGYVTVYDVTPAGSIFGDGSDIVGRWVWADLMMPSDQFIECPDETGTTGQTGPTSACRWIASGMTCEAT